MKTTAINSTGKYFWEAMVSRQAVVHVHESENLPILHIQQFTPFEEKE
jgi:hypothetical protein